jgi:hypothetical protein
LRDEQMVDTTETKGTPIVQRLLFPVLLAAALVGSFAVQARAQDLSHGVQEFNESGTWRVPAGVTRITIELWGGGGGGAGAGSAALGADPGGGGGGGGSGAYLRASLGVKEGETYTMRIGAGGAGGVGQSRQPPQPGADGQATSLLLNDAIILIAAGGHGGKPPAFGSTSGGSGGAGGEAGTIPVTLARPGARGSDGDRGGMTESTATPGGTGAQAIVGAVVPPGSFGGDGAHGLQFGYSDGGKSGGAGSLVITW